VVRVKICGITSPNDALAAADAGADAIGINLVAGPRRVDTDQAAAIAQALPPFCTPVALVGLEHGQLSGEVLELLGRCWISHVQLYGDVTPNAVASLRQDGFHPLLVHHVTAELFPTDMDAKLAAMAEAPPRALVLDAYDPDRLGGTGQPVDWSMLAEARVAGRLTAWPPVVLAGGLNPGNVANAVRTVHPWAVDVSSGVEATVGKKDPAKMRAFVAAVRESS